MLAQANVRARASGELKLVHNREISDRHRHLVDPLHVIVPPPLEDQRTRRRPPTEIGPFNANPISFDNGVPVGGSMTLALFQDGFYSFSGHFHDSGFPSYDVEAVWVIVSNSGKAFTFQAQGETHGTVDPGSRNFDFAQNGNNDTLREAWEDLCAGYHWRWSAYAGWSISDAVNDVIGALKTAGTVIALVVAIV